MSNHIKVINNGFNWLHKIKNVFTFLTNLSERINKSNDLGIEFVGIGGFEFELDLLCIFTPRHNQTS